MASPGGKPSRWPFHALSGKHRTLKEIHPAGRIRHWACHFEATGFWGFVNIFANWSPKPPRNLSGHKHNRRSDGLMAVNAGSRVLSLEGESQTKQRPKMSRGCLESYMFILSDQAYHVSSNLLGAGKHQHRARSPPSASDLVVPSASS